MSNNVLVICGPTATGKTALAQKIALSVDGEIVSADSRQVYREMNIGTGKGLERNLKFKIQSSKFQFKSQNYQIGYYEVGGVRIWLYDVVAPDQRFSVAEYTPKATAVIKDIQARGKIPLLVGGTGLYLDSIFSERETFGILPDATLRKELELKTTGELVAQLEKLNPEKLKVMNNSDRANPRRLIRAIEVATYEIAASQTPLPAHLPAQAGAGRKDAVAVNTTPPNPIYLGLTSSLPFLYQKIDSRIDSMMKAGLLAEIQGLLRKYGWNAPGMSGIGYRQFQPYFMNRASLEDCVARVKFDTHSYARRQMTWFKRNKKISWFDVGEFGFDELIPKLVELFR